MDKKKLAVIHIVKKELRLSEQEYRDILEKTAGVRSAAELDAKGFAALMRYFVRSRHWRAAPEAITFRQKLFIRHLVAEAGWTDEHFANFLKKYHKESSLERLNKKEASNVIESMKNVVKHKR